MPTAPRVLLWLALIAVAGAAPAAAQEPGVRRSERIDIRGLVVNRKFEQAEARLQAAQRDYERDPRQAQAVEDLFAAFNNHDSVLTAPLDEWVTRFPESAMPRLARGVHSYALGFKARGTDTWSKTPKASRAAMDAPFLQGVRDLHAALKINPRLMSGYAYLIYAAAVYGERQTIRGIFEEGRKIDPASFVLREAYLFALQPKWGGSAAASEVLIVDTRQYYDRNPRLKVLEARHHRQRGERMLEAKQYTQALVEFDKAIAVSPDGYNSRRGRGRVYEALGRYPEAFTNFLDAAERGDGWSQSMVTTYYLHGHAGVTSADPEKARYWAQRAIQKGEKYAKYQMGWMYLNGRGVPRDHEQAARWLGEAAKEGVTEAVSSLAALYWEGSGVARDRERAAALWREAAAKGDAYAKQSLQQHGLSP